MIIKKYEAQTQTEAIMLARDELGKDAVIMNIKTINPKGIARLFKKTRVEITAAADDSVVTQKNDENSEKEENFLSKASKSDEMSFKEKSNFINGNIPSLKAEVAKTLLNQEKKETSALEEKLDSLQSMLEKQIEAGKEQNNGQESVTANQEEKEEKSKAFQCMELVKKQLMSSEVDEKYVDMLIHEVSGTVNPDASVDNILTAIYQKIVLKLGQPKVIHPGDDCPKYIFFMGPTGVGKTTSIAKIASDLKLNQKLDIALVTSDTYRIAAVDQLRTYANILNVPVKVIYTEDDLKNNKEELDKYDMVLVDTAGRSHKSREQREDLRKLIDVISPDNRLLFLVLSATTKYSDLVHIVDSYSDFNGYSLIFTKLDETDSYGNILNLKLLTGAPLAYAAWGQDVPNDIGKIDTQNIAKQLLGGNN